ncbi:protein-methionine-sulfoxide reductase heme-binding subunit MsrQ [Tabrizicola sp. TH137]|uniref:protein-methionine-sulfoxide reductase heme-binding subunit MsrQ n=1 Tax=Tabrizicola sp. TH137 TaxID=2067452 RepID=UPI000C7C41F7|nr:protein-methionine-sulfoxide reductase heme-binding subunit MsrQ [Tabrizicola sp. TH137]PLL14850.1 protein-methionine-sulfoxide reductase heme-binding subunit MsrQ [Tabrizicola sp. TH137]
MDRINTLARRVPVNAVYLAGVLPFLWIVWLTLTNGLGPDPVKAIELRLGELGLQFIVAGLLVTPLRWAGLNLIRFRRAIGLLAFFYVTMHLLTWVVLDMGLRWDQMAADLLKRWYIIIGMIAFLAMLPLAITSNNASIRRLGAAAWNRLHRLTYVAALGGAIHYLMLVKAWPVEPLAYLSIILVLLAARVWHNRRRRMPQTA